MLKLILYITAIASDDEPFGGTIFSAGLQTFIMSTGEYNFGDRRFSNTLVNGKNDTSDTEVLGAHVSHHEKTQIILAQIIFAAFVFLAVVLMNLLNAFAIGDIEVKHNVRNRFI